MKKVTVIILAIVMALLISIFAFLKINNDRVEDSMPDIEQVEAVDQETAESAEESVITESETTIKEDVTKSENTVINKNTGKRIKKESTRPMPAKGQFNNSAAPATKSKYTKEEEELLKKIPRSDEVVVDKEIKIKSSGKYIFR